MTLTEKYLRRMNDSRWQTSHYRLCICSRLFNDLLGLAGRRNGIVTVIVVHRAALPLLRPLLWLDRKIATLEARDPYA